MDFFFQFDEKFTRGYIFRITNYKFSNYFAFTSHVCFAFRTTYK